MYFISAINNFFTKKLFYFIQYIHSKVFTSYCLTGKNK